MRRRAGIAVIGVAASTAVAMLLAGPRRVGRKVRRLLGRGRSHTAARQKLASTARETAAAGIADGAVPKDADDLKVIEGIGPRIASVLYEAGIKTYAQVADSSPGRLEAVMKESGRKMADPTTWPEQARLAAAGDWAALEILQSTLKRGRRTPEG